VSKSLAQWLAFIDSIHGSRIDLSLQRIEEIAKAQNLTQFEAPVITVAGTNGKGSCVSFLENIYLAAGYRVAAYYSPHLLRFNERIRVNGTEISDDELVTAFEKVEAFRQNRSLSFFEYTTLAAFLIFQSHDVDVILLEVGLGGRLDAVNVVDADVAVVTSIGLDHQEWLGDDRESIGYEKAGIYRRQRPAICSDLDPPESVSAFAKQLDSNFLQINKDFSYKINVDSWEWKWGSVAYRDLPLTQLKCQNAAASLMALASLQGRLSVDEASIRKGLKNTILPGRFEKISGKVNMILDVAHNPDSARWLKQQLENNPVSGQRCAVVAMLKDKELENTLDALLPQIDQWYFGALDVERAGDPADIKQHLQARGVKNCYNFSTVQQALDEAIKECSHSEDQVVVFGSFHTVAAAKERLGDLGYED
jgi:dihydrofolate synthase / folylpolyglutamate synthase